LLRSAFRLPDRAHRVRAKRSFIVAFP